MRWAPTVKSPSRTKISSPAGWLCAGKRVPGSKRTSEVDSPVPLSIRRIFTDTPAWAEGFQGAEAVCTSMVSPWGAFADGSVNAHGPASVEGGHAGARPPGDDPRAGRGPPA